MKLKKICTLIASVVCIGFIQAQSVDVQTAITNESPVALSDAILAEVGRMTTVEEFDSFAQSILSLLTSDDVLNVVLAQAVVSAFDQIYADENNVYEPVIKARIPATKPSFVPVQAPDAGESPEEVELEVESEEEAVTPTPPVTP